MENISQIYFSIFGADFPYLAQIFPYLAQIFHIWLIFLSQTWDFFVFGSDFEWLWPFLNFNKNHYSAPPPDLTQLLLLNWLSSSSWIDSAPLPNRGITSESFWTALTILYIQQKPLPISCPDTTNLGIKILVNLGWSQFGSTWVIPIFNVSYP